MHQTLVPLIDLENVSLSLPSRAGEVAILEGIGFRIWPGETVGILGSSGSGKTSLLMIMAGLEQASGGKVMVAGESLTGRTEDELARIRGRSIGIVFQSFHLLPTMTALENVALPLELAGARDAFPRAKEALAGVGLAGRHHHLPAQLSGGEQQRVAIARALVVRPPILLADEPTGNLDARTGADVMDLLFEVKRQHGTTLVLVTHDPRLAARCTRRITLSDGRIQELQEP